jgi:hypothetical protein
MMSFNRNVWADCDPNNIVHPKNTPRVRMHIFTPSAVQQLQHNGAKPYHGRIHGENEHRADRHDV